MTSMIERLSVFFPAYNEEKNIQQTVLKAIEVLEEDFKDWEIIVVNDGSKDRTGEIVRKMALNQPRLKLIEHYPNRGYGVALRSGLYNARFDWIAFTDADGQFDFSEINNFLRVQRETGADLVIGYYLRRSVPLYRLVNTFFWEALVNLLFGLRVKDIDCGFKLFSRRVVEGIPPLESERGAFVSTEFLVKAQREDFKIVEVGVHHYPRRTGYGTGANINVILRSFIDLFRLWGKLR